MNRQQPDIDKNISSKWLTVKLLAEYEPAFTTSALRNLIYQAEDRKTSKGVIKGNGLAPAIRRIGSKVLINHQAFLAWIESSGGYDGQTS